MDEAVVFVLVFLVILLVFINFHFITQNYMKSIIRRLETLQTSVDELKPPVEQPPT
jgi:hypothetical protein